jgi:hypothetical protein
MEGEERENDEERRRNGALKEVERGRGSRRK